MEKPEWIDTTSYTRDDKDRKPHSWSMDFGRLRVTVIDNHIYHGGKWIMHLHPLFTERELKAVTVEQAKAEALQIARVEIEKINAALKALA